MESQTTEHIFIDLVNKNQGIIHKVCGMYRRDADDRKDLFQEIVIQLWKAFPTFRNESKISTWLYRVALNTAISHYRKNKKSPESIPLSPAISETIENQDNVTTEENSKVLYTAIEKLTDIEKAMVMLYLEEHPYEEIAEVMGITQNYVRVKMNRIREKLKKIINPVLG